MSQALLDKTGHNGDSYHTNQYPKILINELIENVRTFETHTHSPTVT